MLTCMNLHKLCIIVCKLQILPFKVNGDNNKDGDCLYEIESILCFLKLAMVTCMSLLIIWEKWILPSF